MRRLHSSVTKLNRNFKVFSCAQQEIEPSSTQYPITKYHLIPQYLVQNQIIESHQIDFQPIVATREDLLLVHDAEYVDQYVTGTLSAEKLRRIGIQWSERAVRRSLCVVGATCSAARYAYYFGKSANLAGGQHHAATSYGSGYCVFNDMVVAAEKLRAEGRIKNWLCIDLDVHQGDGTGEITFGKYDHAFVVSFHAAKNFPYKKLQCHIDVEFEDKTNDDEYLLRLEQVLSSLKEKFRQQTLKFDMILYQAGVDVLGTDSLGRLNLSMQGIAIRDKMVMDFSNECQVPIVVVLGGGYPKNASYMDTVVKAHCQTIQILKDSYL